jgi:hypothetical protein
MFKRMLDGRQIGAPFMGAATLSVTEGDWRHDSGLPGQPPRDFFTRYKEAGSSGTVYQAGWLQIIWEPKENAANTVVKAMGWLLAGRFAMINASLILILGT